MTDSPNVAQVRAIYADWERSDLSVAEWTDPEGIRQWAHPQVEFVFADGRDPGAWRGPAAMSNAMRERMRTVEEFSIKAEEYRELDSERVPVLTRRSGRAKMSGLELAQLGSNGAAVYYLLNGKVTKIVNYFDPRRGLADLELTPEADSPN